MSAPSFHVKLLEWFAKGETGLSSTHMATVSGGASGNSSHPRDPSDLNRCIKLVDEVPEVREHFAQIAATTPQWGIVIANWDDLASRLKSEANGNPYFDAPVTYRRMKDLGL